MIKAPNIYMESFVIKLRDNNTATMNSDIVFSFN